MTGTTGKIILFLAHAVKGGLIMDYELLKRLIDDIPQIDRSIKKEPTSNKMREFVRERDKICKVCGEEGNKRLPRLEVHHKIPNGPATGDNLILLCEFCHEFVNNMLKSKGYAYPPKWWRNEHRYS